MFDGSMTMPFHSLNCPSYLVGGRNNHRTQFKIHSFNRGFAVKASILLPTDDNGNLPESESFKAPTSSRITDSVLSHANTVGIIGGVSAVSTMRFLKKLVGWSLKDGEETLPFIVCNDPVLNRELSSHERGSFPFLSLKNVHTHWDHTPIVENLRRKRSFLERAGARCIVMPCHISHSWHSDISEGCSVPFLHVGECVAKELKEANLKPIAAGSSVRIGVLATDATLKADFYREKLQNLGFEVVLPDKATMDSVSVSASISDNLQNSRNPKPTVPIDPLFSSETRSSSCEDKDNCSLSAASSSSFSGLLRQLSELEQSVLGYRSQIPADTPLHARSRSEGGRVGESVAVVKDSDDPLTDFRRSMLQMIVEKEIVGGEELKELLQRFLSLNAPHHHDVIVRAFAEIWNEVFSGYQNTPDFLVKLRR